MHGKGDVDSSSGSSSSSTALQDQIIQYARQFEGTPYVYGGKSPSTGFNCSGYVSYVYKHFGINLTPYTYSMKNEGTNIGTSTSSIQPSDIVFFNNFEHVGIAISQTQYIHAPQPGDKVKISNFAAWGTICMIMRVI